MQPDTNTSTTTNKQQLPQQQQRSIHVHLVGRRGGLVASALDSGPSGLGSSAGRGHMLCCWARHFTLTDRRQNAG